MIASNQDLFSDCWFRPLSRDWAFHTNQEFFEWAGGDSVLMVAPDDVMLVTQDAEAISQIMARREAFPKDIERYGVLNTFGKNVVTTEAAVWRMHRRITASSFNEKNAAHTFAESLRQTEGLIKYLFGQEGGSRDSTGTIKDVEHLTMRWALNIIGYVGFGLRLIFPGEKLPEDPKLAKYGSLEAPPGYTLTFAESLGGLLEKIIFFLLVPDWLLKSLPFELTRKAWEAKDNYRKYMDEFLADKIDEVRIGDREKVGMDIMGELVRSSYGEKESKTTATKLTDGEIISNAFIMTLAGHETTANVLHFCLVLLATNPSAQRKLQKDVDELLGDSDPSTWDYDRNINALLANHVGACINETMRVMPPVAVVPKMASPVADQSITLKGEKHVIPAGISLSMLTSSAHRNPRQWPTRPSARTGKAHDLEDWLPDRWYNNTAKAGGNENDNGGDNLADYGGFQGSDTSASLYRPVRGSYFPFSDGARSCLGRRLAVVELAAALPVIFQKYSVELAVDKWANDEDVERMSVEEKRKVYAQAQENSRKELASATAIITLKFHDGQHVPIRLVKRGRERFIGDLGLNDW